MNRIPCLRNRWRPSISWLVTLFAGFLIVGADGAWGGEAVALNPPPYDVDSLAPRIYSTKIDRQAVTTDPSTGDIHLLLGYMSGGSFQLLDANLARETVRVVDGVAGRLGPNAMAVHPDGKLYLASVDPGYLLEYDVRTGSMRQLKKLADKGGQWMEIGDDGAVYVGEMVKGHVERYDPATGKLEDLGIIDDPGPPYYRYAYTLGADRRYVYVGIGQNPWYLAVYDRQTRTTKTWWKELKTGVAIAKGTKGGWYARVNALGWFALRNGVPEPLDFQPDVIPFEKHGGVCNKSDLSQCNLPYDIDLNSAVPVASVGSEAQALISWRKKGDAPWRTVSAGVRVVPQVIKQLVAGPKDQVFGLTGFYGPIFEFSTKAPGKLTLLGKNLRSNYDALYLPENGRWYLAGYPAALMEFDPGKPWSLRSESDPASPQVNPRQPVKGFGKYQYYLARGSDGFVYVGAQHERDSVGGELGWYDPATGKTGSLRAPFEQFDVRDLKPALGGTSLIFSSAALKTADGRQTDGRLLVFDVATKRVVREVVPLPGWAALDKVVETSPGIVVGVAGSEVYAVDVRDGRVLYRKPLGARFDVVRHYDRRINLGPDGHVWLVLSPEGQGGTPQLSRIDPADGTVQMLQGIAGLMNFLLVRNAEGTGYDALLYGTEEIKLVKGVLRLVDDVAKGSGG